MAFGDLQRLDRRLERAISTRVTSLLHKYPHHREQLKGFFCNYETPGGEIGPHGSKHYMNELQKIKNHKSVNLTVRIDDVVAYVQKTLAFDGPDTQSIDPDLPTYMIVNTLRYIQLLFEAAGEILVRLNQEYDANDSTETNIVEVSEFERGFGLLKKMEAANVPIHMRSPYEIHVVPPSSMKGMTVREVRAEHMGRLVKMEGVVTKVTLVKPRIQVAHYVCLDCNEHCHQPIEGPFFMPIDYCRSPQCANSQKKGELHLILPDCKFVKYQEIKVQEPVNRVPRGAVPRVQKIVVEGNLTRILVPGMACTLSGILCPIMKTPQAMLNRGLITETTFQVENIEVHKKGYYDDIEGMTKAEAEEATKTLKKYEDDPSLYEKLSRSIAPSIHGLEDVKKILLLQLVGGVTEKFDTVMTIRGDIHVLLMGDPGVAKSQLLGEVCRIAPRAHYTTGKGSSGVGLTAMIAKDSTTGDFVLEGGAIVLSDRGLCCIDEFDKMDEYDRSALHEVMEQQTVSICKAGINATLNARTAILAAANPQYGRYDIKKTPMENINLPAALLSRFDIQYLLLDKADRIADETLAKHVLKVHQLSGGSGDGLPSNEKSEEYLDARTIRLLVAKAKSFTPYVPEEMTSGVIDYYVSLRQAEKEAKEKGEHTWTYTTPRSLVAILRLAQAKARLRFSNVVEEGDLEEALRLIAEASHSVSEEYSTTSHKKKRIIDYQSEVFDILKDIDNKRKHQQEWDGWIKIVDIEKRCASNGIVKEQILETLEAYVELEVLQWSSSNKLKIGFVESLAAK